MIMDTSKTLTDFNEWISQENFFKTIPETVTKNFLNSSHSYFQDIEALKASASYKNFGNVWELYVALSNLSCIAVHYLKDYNESTDAKTLLEVLFFCFSKQIDSRTSVDLITNIGKKLNNVVK